MYKRVVVSEAQGVSETDFERLGAYPQTGFEFLGRDLLQTNIVYAGFTVSQSDTVTVQVTPGRVYDSGRMYASEGVEERSVAAYVPVTAGQSNWLKSMEKALCGPSPRASLAMPMARLARARSLSKT